MKRSIVLVVVLAFILTGCGEANISKVGSASDTPQSSPAAAQKEDAPKESPSTSPDTPEVFSVGDSVQFDDLVITVHGVRESKSELFKPDEGNVILLVDVSAENKGSEEAAVSSMLQTEVVDTDGFKYNLTIVDDAKGSFDGSVGAGRKLRGEIAYEVPKDASIEFIFSDPFKSGQAIWKLK